MKLVCIGFVVLALFFLLAGKNKDFGRKFMEEDYGVGGYREPDGKVYLSGDLFSYCRIESFREKIIETKLQTGTPIDKADIILKGDSFFNTGYDSYPVPNALQKITGKNIFYLPTSGYEITPLKYLEKIDYRSSAEKLFIVETIERNVMLRTQRLQSDFVNDNQDGNYLTTDSRWFGIKDRIKNILFDRIGVEYFIKNNLIFKPINNWFKNKAFNWLGDIDSKTPIYSNNPKMLFFDEEVNFGKDKKKLDSINESADNVAKEARLIKEKYNLVLVYLIIPDKLSIYGDSVAGYKKYDNFIPRFQEALKVRGVKYVDIYQVLSDYHNVYPNDLLYYSGDTHYLPKAKELLINKLLNSDLDF
ncbi:MAG: hypothetical protein WCT50_04715 [Patescibacteria group bacterium]